MKKKPLKTRLIKSSWRTIFVTLFMAVVLTILPMPVWLNWVRPAWVLMVLVSFTFETSFKVGVGTAWSVGIVLDILNGTLLGEHAFALAVVIYLVVRLQERIKMFRLFQQSIVIFLLVMLHNSIIFCIQGLQGQLPQNSLYWLSSVTSMLLWPWVVTILQDRSVRF